MERLAQRYELGTKIGRGSQAPVTEVRCKLGKGTFAGKHCYSKKEVDMHSKLEGCPGKVALVEVIREKKKKDALFWGTLIFEHCACTLKKRWKQGLVSEKEAAAVGRNLAQTLQFMHSRGVVYRDLRLENIFMSEPSPPYTIKIANLDSATDDEQEMEQSCATPRYMAPEMADCDVDGPYTKAVDLWGLGAILYELVVGLKLLAGVDTSSFPEYLQGLTQEKLEADLCWREASAEAKELIMGLLRVDPEERLTLPEVICHPWIVGNTSDDEFDVIRSKQLPECEVTKKRKRNDEKDEKELMLVFQTPLQHLRLAVQRCRDV